MLEVWLLWAYLLGFVGLYGLRVLVDTRHMFAPPLVLGFIVSFILVKSYFDFDDLARATLMDIDYYIVSLAFAALSLTAFAACFELATRMPSRPSRAMQATERLSTTTIAIYVTVIGIIGIGAQVIFASYSGGLAEFYSKAHGQAGAYEEVSGYLIALPFFLWSALVIGAVTLYMRGLGSPLLIAAVVVIAAALTANTILFGNRDGIIRLCLTAGVGYVFVYRPSLTRSLPLISILVAAVIAVSVVGYLRVYLHLGAERSVSEGIAEQITNKDRAKFDEGETGHELIFNVGVIHAVSKSGVHTYGLPYLFPFISFVPRAVWPDKPYSVDFGINLFELVQTTLGWRPIGGAAINSITESFVAFSWIGCLVTGLFGLLSGRIYARAMRHPSVFSIGALITVLVACVYWASQSFPAVFFQSLYTIVPIAALAFMADKLIGGRHRNPRKVAPAPVRRSATPRN